MSQIYTGVPGIQAERTASPRRVFLSQEGASYLPNSIVIDGTKSRDPGNTGDLDVLRNGMLIGKITSGGKFAPSLLGVTTNAEAIGSTSIQAGAAVITELVRRIGSSGTFKLVGPAIAGGAVDTETVTYSAASGTDITCTALTKAFIAGSFIMPTDGSESPLFFINNEDGNGVKVTDQDGASLSSVPIGRIPVSGIIDSSNVVNWPSEVSLQDWITGWFPKFTFDHTFGL